MRVLACLDERPPKRSLADDPNFLASLSELDRGLSDEDEPQPASPRPVTRTPPVAITPAPVARPITIAAPPPPLAAHSAPTPSAVGLPEPPPWLPPTAFAAITAASEALSVAVAAQPFQPQPATSQPTPRVAASAGASPRTLLDLFPPAASREATAPSLPVREHAAPPPIAAVEPPRVAVRPRAFPAPASARTGEITYETFYGFDEKPFGASADLRFLYHSAAHDRVLQDLLSSVARKDAVALLTGEPGIGKTMLCRALVEQLDRRTLVSFVADPVTSADDLLKTLLVDFGVISADDVAAGHLASASHDDLAGALRDFLSSLVVLQASALLIVDQAHKLTLPVFREIQTLSEIAEAGHVLQIVLVGETSLRFDPHVGLRLELGPLEEDEVAGYVAHRVAVSGRGGRVEFSEAALRRVYTMSGGVPGIVNQICDRALLLGYRASASRISVEFVDEAARALGLSAEIGESWRDRALVAVLLIVLMLAGAAGAGWVFREPLKRTWAQWHGGDPSITSTEK